MELIHTVPMMASLDCHEELKAEYAQLVIRYDNVKKDLSSWEEGTLGYKPTCPKSVVEMQLVGMKQYIAALEARMIILGIELPKI